MLFLLVYHFYETNLKMRLLGLGKAKAVAKLNDEAAAELGAEMLGELIVFSVGVLCLTFEYQRQQNKDRSKEEYVTEKLIDLQKSVNLITIQIENQDAKIREMDREICAHRK